MIRLTLTQLSRKRFHQAIRRAATRSGLYRYRLNKQQVYHANAQSLMNKLYYVELLDSGRKPVIQTSTGGFLP